MRPEAPAPPPTSGPRLRATDLSVGERVVHGAYGAGVVIEVRSRDETAVIDFPAGRKTLSLAYAPLKRP